MAIAEAAPYVLFGLVGGAVGDRVPRTALLIGLDLTRGVLQLTTAALVVTGRASYPILIGTVFVLQLGGAFFNPAHRSLLPEIVETGSLPAANGLVDLSTTAAPLLQSLA